MHAYCITLVILKSASIKYANIIFMKVIECFHSQSIDRTDTIFSNA